jgi:hypothetical protein
VEKATVVDVPPIAAVITEPDPLLEAVVKVKGVPDKVAIPDELVVDVIAGSWPEPDVMLHPTT